MLGHCKLAKSNRDSVFLLALAIIFSSREFSLAQGSGPRDIAVDSQGIAWALLRD